LAHPEVVRNMASSLDLYFQKFAFNASFYYVFWETGLLLGQYTMDKTLGPLLAPVAAAGVLYAAYRVRPGVGPEPWMVAALVWHLLWSSTVHPWYLCLPLAFAAAGRARFAGFFVLAWSGTAVFSYSHYAGGVLFERYPWVVAEYVVALSAAVVLWCFYPSLPESPTK
jgi:hypothetical protein